MNGKNMENDEKKEPDEKITWFEIVGYIYEYGLYVLFAVAIGLLLKMIVSAFL